MLKRFLVGISCLVVILTVQSPLCAIPPASFFQDAPDTLMLFAHQADDPVRIVQASFGADNELLDARLENSSHKKIQNYRLGWAVVKKDDVRLGKGTSAADVPENVDSSTAFNIPGQGNVAKDDLSKHPTGIVFYIAELQFQDGSHWQADVKKIKKEATDLLK